MIHQELKWTFETLTFRYSSTLYSVCSIPWGCSVLWVDIMSTGGDILSTVGSTSTVLNTPMVLMISPTCIMVSPHGTQSTKVGIPPVSPNGTQSTKVGIPSWYWIPSTVLMISPSVLIFPYGTQGIPPTVLNTLPAVLNTHYTGW